MQSFQSFSLILTLILSLSSLDGQRVFPRFNTSGTGIPANSILPTPNGPFYGQPFDLSATMARRLPLTVSGNCEAGKIYMISKGADLVSHNTELECIFNAGLVPSKVPEGAYHGSILSMINTKLFNSVISRSWKGKMVNRVPCNGNEMYVGWNNIGNNPLSPFFATLGPLDLNLAPGEYNDGKDSLILDYTQDFRQVCPDYRTYLQNNYQKLVIRRRNLNGVYPLNQMVESLRLVGIQEDGGSIYLGKSYLRDFYRTDLQAATVGYWYIVNYDETVAPKMKVGENLPALKTSFKYMLPGSVDLALRLLPVDNLITTPIRTIGKFVRGLLKSGKNSIQYAGEITRGLASSRGNRQRFRNFFNSNKQMKNRESWVKDTNSI